MSGGRARAGRGQCAAAPSLARRVAWTWLAPAAQVVRRVYARGAAVDPLSPWSAAQQPPHSPHLTSASTGDHPRGCLLVGVQAGRGGAQEDKEGRRTCRLHPAARQPPPWTTPTQSLRLVPVMPPLLLPPPPTLRRRRFRRHSPRPSATSRWGGHTGYGVVLRRLCADVPSLAGCRTSFRRFQAWSRWRRSASPLPPQQRLACQGF